MKNTRNRVKIASTLIASALTGIVVLAVAIFSPSEVMAAAGGIQNCTAGATCTVGEFLYDDTSTPISGATCTITSSYPDLTSFVASTALSGGGSNGWYYYSFTTPTTTGMYPTTISCTVSGDTLSIDKSFQVNAAVSTASVDTNSIAEAVWGYSSRTVTSFGSLISDFWNSTIKNSAGKDVTPIADLATIKKNTSETRLLIEKVANKPVIENVLQNSNLAPLGDKLTGTRSMANQIYVNNQFLTQQSAALASAWNGSNGKDLLSKLIALSSVVGSSADSSSANSMFGTVNSINDSWNWEESHGIYNQLVATDKLISDLKVGLSDYQKTPALYATVKQLVKNSIALEKTVGVVTDTGVKPTLFGKIKSTNDLTVSLDEKGAAVGKVLGEYTKSGDTGKAVSQIYDLQNQIIAINKVAGAQNALVKVDQNNANSIKNALLGLRGIVDSNKMLLSLGAGKTLLNTWMELGSIIFKTLVTNPSNLISQTVELKYYLPEELKKEDIIKADPSLTVEYDSEKDQLFVKSDVTLAPGQTKTFSVETKDIWSYSKEEIASLRNQAETLFAPLVKTSYYAQAVSLKSDINANLDQITNLLGLAVTPEEKIKAYRESVILKKSVDEKLSGLKELVGQASASGSLLGFVGGSQAVAVWGIIVIVIAGFVFLTVYMRSATARKIAAEIKEAGEPELDHAHHKRKVPGGGIHPAAFITVMVVSSILSASATGFVVNNIVSKNYMEKLQVLGTQTVEPVATPLQGQRTSGPEANPLINDVTPAGPEKAGTEKAGPENAGPETSSGQGGQYLVVVSDTPTGTLNVRSAPGGIKIVGNVKPWDKLPYIGENGKYFNVKLEDGTEGWISKEYSLKQ